MQLFEMSDLSMVQRIAKEMARMHAMPLSAELSAEDVKQTVSSLDEIPQNLDTEEKTTRCIQ